MKKGFPNKFLGIFPYGWKNKGKVGSNYIGNDVIRFKSHTFCDTRLNIGKENGELFMYCPKCLIKLKKQE